MPFFNFYMTSTLKTFLCLDHFFFLFFLCAWHCSLKDRVWSSFVWHNSLAWSDVSHTLHSTKADWRCSSYDSAGGSLPRSCDPLWQKVPQSVSLVILSDWLRFAPRACNCVGVSVVQWMRAIHVSVRVAPVRGALSHDDHGNCAY